MTPPVGPVRSGPFVAAAGRFALVGMLCAVINVGIIFVGHDLLGWHYIAAALSTCLVTIPLGYVLHGRFSFRVGRRESWAEFARFVGVQLGQFSIGFLLLTAQVELLSMPPAIGMVIVSVLMYLFSFIASSTWVYRVLAWRPHDDAPGSH